MKKNLTALLLVFAFVFPTIAFGQTTVIVTPKEKKMAEAITAAQISDYLHFVASDEMGGRDTPSNGLDLTAKFIATLLSRWGFKPAGDNGSYFQKITLKSDTIDASKTMLSVGGQAFKLGDDFFRVAGSGTAADASLVFGGDGWMVKAKGIDALANVDVKGKIVVFQAGTARSRNGLIPPPAGVTPDDLKGTRGVDWADSVTNAASKGAAGVIMVASPDLQQMWEMIKGSFTRGSMAPEKLQRAPMAGAATIPQFLVSTSVGEAIFAGSANARNVAFYLGKSASMGVATKSENKYTQNVVAIWEGSDPVLKKEMVAIGAHYDHVGTNPNARGDDKIFNGADDDGSGTTAVLSIAEALAKAPVRPKRSVLFVWHVGEEKGLWGSEYFNKFPTVDIKQVIAQLNIDMIGRSKKEGDTNPKNKDLSGPDGIYVIGAEMMSSTLGAVAKGTNSAYLKLGYDYRYDDPKDTNRFFFRSDHFNYAVNGIPIVFWFDGVHEDYHQAGDEPDKIDYQKMEKVARTIFLTLWELTDLKARPKVDKQLPPELTQR